MYIWNVRIVRKQFIYMNRMAMNNVDVFLKFFLATLGIALGLVLAILIGIVLLSKLGDWV